MIREIGSGDEKDPTTEELKAIIDNFAANTNAAGLQFSGGEPTLREDLPELISYARKKFEHVEVGCHFSCGAFSYLVIEKNGKVEPITKYVDMGRLAAAYKKKNKIPVVTALRSIRPGFLKELFIGFVKSHDYRDLSDLHFNLLFIGAMHFMDPYNFDFARLKKCVIHYGLPDGRIVPFCSHNNIHRSGKSVSVYRRDRGEQRQGSEGRHSPDGE